MNRPAAIRYCRANSISQGHLAGLDRRLLVPIRDRDCVLNRGVARLKPDRFDEPLADCVHALDVVLLKVGSDILGVRHYPFRVVQDDGFVPHQGLRLGPLAFLLGDLFLNFFAPFVQLGDRNFGFEIGVKQPVLLPVQLFDLLFDARQLLLLFFVGGTGFVADGVDERAQVVLDQDVVKDGLHDAGRVLLFREGRHVAGFLAEVVLFRADEVVVGAAFARLDPHPAAAFGAFAHVVEGVFAGRGSGVYYVGRPASQLLLHLVEFFRRDYGGMGRFPGHDPGLAGFLVDVPHHVAGVGAIPE